MYTGHIGIALGAKGVQKQASLWLLCVAALLPDLIDFSLQMIHVDTSAWTHSLAGMIGSGVLLFTAAWIVSRSVAVGAAVGIVACSHVLADLLTSCLQLWPGGGLVGLHWYRHPMLDFGVEAGTVVAGWLLYGRTLSERRRFSLASLAMVMLLLALQGYMATLDIS